MINGGIQDGVPTVSEGQLKDSRRLFRQGLTDLDLFVKKITPTTEDELFQACVCTHLCLECSPSLCISQDRLGHAAETNNPQR